MNNPRPDASRVLAWKSLRGWEIIKVFDINRFLNDFTLEALPKTRIGRVRLFLKMAEEQKFKVALKRYFETWNYEENQRKLEAFGGSVAL